MQLIDILGAAATWVENLAGDGSIQGSYVDAATWEGRGYSLAPNGDLSVIHVPGGISTFVNGGNARGDLVGGYLTQDDQGNYQWGAFIANPIRPRGA
ncbi:MAG TPA: hypothetical protein VLK82_08200 [Candidatus Tectomicrobia bacterium]|nr:hypothetical protein [Candidatus Tectomicrobia bacterium]